MADLPEPLTPPDCDLRGYDFMPLFGNRLFNSHLYRKAIRDPRAGLAAVKLWWVAWLQCPAGSLPDDDDDLAMLADFGLDTKAWSKARTLALHGFVKCSDGRLYHPLLCEEAKEAYERRRKERERKATNRAKKSGQASDGHGSPEVVPRDNPRTDGGTSPGSPAAVPADRTGQDRTGTGQDKESKPREQILRITDSETTWEAATGKWEFDKRNMERKAVAGGTYARGAAEDVLKAARFGSETWNLDCRIIIEWLEAKVSLDTIVATLRKTASRPGYEPPRSLKYFDAAIREQRSKER